MESFEDSHLSSRTAISATRFASTPSPIRNDSRDTGIADSDDLTKMETKRRAGRPRRQSTAEFRAGAVRLLDEGKPVTQVARDLDLTVSALRAWVI